MTIVTYTGGAPENITIRFNLHPYQYLTGDVEFEYEGQHYSFDKRGFSAAININLDEDRDPMGMIKEQLDRVHKSIETKARSIPVPGIGGMMTPERREEISKLLKSGHPWMRDPAGGGMGQGQSYSIKPSKYSRKVSDLAAKFFGVPALYVESYDHD